MDAKGNSKNLNLLLMNSNSTITTVMVDELGNSLSTAAPRTVRYKGPVIDIKIGNIGYIATKQTEQRATGNPNWKVSTMGIYTSLDVGRYLMSTRVIADPIPMEALDHLLDLEFGAMEELVKLIPQADNPVPIIRMLANKWANYQIEGPVVKLVPMDSVKIIHAQRKAGGEDIMAGDLERSEMMFMDRAAMEPYRIRNQKLEVMEILLGRIDGSAKEDFAIPDTILVLMSKIKGRLINTDVASRLASPMYNAYFAMSMLHDYGKISQLAFSRKDLAEASLFGYLQLELIMELEAVMSDQTVSTFTKNEISDARRLDYLQWWFEAVKLMAPVISINFKRTVVGHRIICESANRGRWTLVLKPHWEQIVYSPLKVQLDISGFKSSVLLPVATEAFDPHNIGDYRTTRDTAELGLEFTWQEYDRPEYSQMISDIQMGIGERDFLLVWPTYGPDICVPLRNSILKQLPQLQVLQTGISVDILASEVVAIKNPAMLVEQLADSIYKYKPTLFETIAPWIPS